MKNIFDKIFEDFFDEINNDNITDDIDDSNVNPSSDDNQVVYGDYGITKKNAKFYLRISYKNFIHDLNFKSYKHIVFNIRKFVQTVYNVIEKNGLFPEFSLSKQVIFTSDNSSSKDKKYIIDAPFPEEYDISDGSGVVSFYPILTIYVYFNSIHNYSYKAFCNRIYLLKKSLVDNIIKSPYSSITMDFEHNNTEITFDNALTYEVSGWFGKGTLAKLYNATTDNSEKRDIREQHDYYLDAVIKKNNLANIGKAAEVIAKRKYNVELKLVDVIQKGEPNEFPPIIAFDFNTSADSVNRTELEKIIFYCFCDRIAFDYYYFIHPIIVVRPNCKVNNDKNETGSFERPMLNKGSIRQCFESAIRIRIQTAPSRTKQLWRVRHLYYTKMGSSSSFFIVITNKKGEFMKDPQSFTEASYTGANHLNDAMQQIVPNINWSEK